jgi:hypothetical protein
MHTTRDLANASLATIVQKGVKKDKDAYVSGVIASPDPSLFLSSLPFSFGQ